MSQSEIAIGPVDQIPKGEGRTFKVAGTDIAVFRTHDGAVFATQPFCPHRQGPLADGLTGGRTVVCPLHDRVFDLATGCGLSHEHMQIATFPARVSDGAIWLTPVPNAVAIAAE